MTTESVESSVKHCYSTWSKDYYRDYYGEAAAYPPVHRDVIRDLLVQDGCRRVLDAGCGPASMLRDLVDDVPELFGFDLTPEMVAEARIILGEHGIAADHVWEGSVLEPSAFAYVPEGTERVVDGEGQLGGFDAAICVGVLPHVQAESDAVVLANLSKAVRPGGLVIAEARNQLFSLFTLNRYSHEFFAKELVRLDELDDGNEETRRRLDVVDEEFKQRFRMELPPVRGGKEDEPGYDEVLSRTHNPFELLSVAQRVGLEDVQLKFYHYHVLPPMFEAANPDWFREKSLQLERSDDWRGFFLASAFLVVGRRRAS